MHLSRLRIDITNRAAQRLLQDPYRLHQAVLTAFPSDAPGGGGRVLFRVEPEVMDGVATVIVQSVLAPDWLAGAAKGLLPLRKVDGPKPVSLALRPGQTLRFRLRANPTKKHEGKRLAVLGEEEQLAWLKRKLGDAGLEVGSVRLRDEGLIKGKGGRQDPPMTFLSVLYDGTAKIQEPAKVDAAAGAGIGSGKAFGFGLLSLAAAG